MNTHHHRIRTGLLAGTAAIAIGLVGSANAFATECVVGPGVTQTTTTVTGSPKNDTIDCGGTTEGKTIVGLGGNDTITGTDFADTISGGDGNDTITGGTGADNLDGGLGIDSISGSAGDDTLVGPSNDGSQDTLDGGDNIDTCQGPAPDPDIHASCENTLAPPIERTGLGHSEGGRALRGQRRPVHRPLPDRLQLRVRRHADQEAAARRRPSASARGAVGRSST